VLDRDYDRASSSATDDHTIIDRGQSVDGEESDSTIIIRNGRKGVTGPLVYLIERNGMRAGRVHLVGKETSIGRGPDQDIVLGDETVSKRHAKVRLEDGTFRFWDLASANYSYVVGADGTRTRILEPHVLADGDTILLGEARLTYIEVDRGEDD
jgi:pSer/pThr/pTyr-binding forkhead associated (FHA) protein